MKNKLNWWRIGLWYTTTSVRLLVKWFP